MENNFSGKSIDYHHIIAIILPLLVDQAFIIGLNFINIAMISSVGVNAVSAVGMVDSINLFLMNIFIALSTGGTVVVAQYKGYGDEKMVSRAAAGAVSTVAIVSIAIAMIIVAVHSPMLNILYGNADSDVLKNAQIYMTGCAISYPFFAVFESVCGALRGVSDTKSSMGLSLIMNILYVLLNILFINVLHMGILGMVVSLIIARFVGMCCALIYMLKYTHSLNINFKQILKIDFSVQKKIFLIGIPFAAEQMFFHGGKIITKVFITDLGTNAVAVDTICNTITPTFQIFANALVLAIITVVGQCMGRGEIDDAKKFIKS
ncbi:MAG: MATE family efflux transporter, partial [Oscillospiraceae bacterium]